MAHPGGSPRTVSFLPEEMIALGEEMVQFVSDPYNKVLHLSEWYTIQKRFLYKEWKTFIQRPEFIPYYEQALKIVGKQYLDKSSNVRDGISQRWQRVYFPDLKEQEDEDADATMNRQKQVAGSQPTTINLSVSDGLASGSKLSTQGIPNPAGESAK